MRIRTALLLLALATLPARTAVAAFEGRRMLRCQRSIMHASARFLGRRRQALDRCITKALRCPAALSGGGTADSDPCLGAVALRCRRQLAAASAAERQLAAVGPRCIAPPPGMGVLPADLFDSAGLGFGGMGAFCPQTAIRSDDPADVSRCQRSALACTTDSAMASTAPRGPELLVRLGASLPGAGCLFATLCGNGVIDGEEECDDGPANSDSAPNACRTRCVDAYCGDGVVDDGEECDDGDAVDGDGCDSDCTRTASVCGNGIVEGDEECDDGNAVDGDGCDSDCTLSAPTCGDGVVDPGEECDDGKRNSDRLPDRCRTDCTAPSCGDGVVDPRHGETCEPPGSIVCADDCTLRLPLPLPAFAPTGDSSGVDLTRCQDAILHASARLFDRTRGLVEGCVAAVARCVLGIPEARDPDGVRAAACLAAANRRCSAVLPARAAAGAAVVARLDARCRDRAGAPLPLASLLDPGHGLGFDQMAASCPTGPGASPTTHDLLVCVAGALQCRAENAVARTIPRAYDLLSNLDLDPDADFPCVTDPGLQ